MLAAHHGHTDTVNALLDSGANRYAVNESDWTAAQIAAAAGKDEIAALLNQAPQDEELAITDPEDAESVAWDAPAGAKEIADVDTTAGTETDDLPEALPTGAQGDADSGDLLPPKESKRLPFVAGKTIASKGKTPSEITKDIAMVDYREKPLPLMVEKTSPASNGGSSQAEVRMLYGQQKKVAVREGEVIPDTKFKIVSIRRMLNHSKITDGQPTDVSVVEIEDTRTGKRRKMTARIPATASEPWAVMRAQSTGKYYAVRAGQSFSTADGEHFTVTDVRPSQLVITHNGSGEVSTIPLGR